MKKSDKVLRKPLSEPFSRRGKNYYIFAGRNAKKMPISLHPMLPKVTQFNHMHSFLGMLEKIAYTLQKTDCSTYRHRVSD
jgi:hypothetical protein